MSTPPHHRTFVLALHHQFAFSHCHVFACAPFSSNVFLVLTTDDSCLTHSRRVNTIGPRLLGRRVCVESCDGLSWTASVLRGSCTSAFVGVHIRIGSKGMAAWSARLPRRIGGDERDPGVKKLILNAVKGDVLESRSVSEVNSKLAGPHYHLNTHLQHSKYRTIVLNCAQRTQLFFTVSKHSKLGKQCTLHKSSSW